MFLINVKEEKRRLRARCKKLRESCPPEVKARLDKALTEKVLGLEEYKACETLFVFVSSPIECDTRQIMLLGSILRGNRPLSSLTDTEKGVWQAIEGRFAHAEGDRVVSDIVVLPREGMETLEQAVRQHPCYPALETAVAADFERLLAVLAAIPSQVLHEQMNYVASNEICNSRMMVINDCLADGTLALPEKPEASTIGMWIELR